MYEIISTLIKWLKIGKKQINALKFGRLRVILSITSNLSSRTNIYKTDFRLRKDGCFYEIALKSKNILFYFIF